MKTSYKKVYTKATPKLCKGITSYNKQTDSLTPNFEECIEIYFEKDGSTTDIVITKQTAEQLQKQLDQFCHE